MHGDQNNLITIKAPAGGANIASWKVTNSDYISFSGLSVLNANGSAVEISHSNFIFISNGEFSGYKNYGITGTTNLYLNLNSIEVHNSANHNIYLSGPSSGFTLVKSKIYKSGKIGVHLDPYSGGGPVFFNNAYLDDNLIYGNADGAILCAGLTNSSIVNNVIYNVEWGISLFAWKTVPGPNNVSILFNTVHLPSGNAAAQVVDSQGSMSIHDNIFYIETTGSGIRYEKSSDVDNTESSYNILDSVEVGTTVTTLKEWQAQGHEKNSIGGVTAAKLWVDPGLPSLNYHLISTAPAIDHGENVPGVTVDFDGNKRPQGNTSCIGAYEYVPKFTTISNKFLRRGVGANHEI